MGNIDWAVVLGALLALSELLSMIPSLKSNGIFQMVVNILKRLGASTSGVAAVPPATFPPADAGK